MAPTKPRQYTSNSGYLYSLIYQKILSYKHENMEKTKENIDEFVRERNYIRHSLSFLVPDTQTSISELADCFSDIHKSIIFPFESERVKQPYWNILSNENLLRQWKKAEYYIDNALIFKVIVQ